MEAVKQFLEVTSIHGLTYVGLARRNVKVFWILVVLSGFTVAGFLIYHSMRIWNTSPIKTTIETRPISEITLPILTVCPPRKRFTNLNYDLLLHGNKTLDEDKRDELVSFALEMLEEYYFKEVMKNISKLANEMRYQNWYMGDEDIILPYYNSYSGLVYEIHTWAKNGLITTTYFEQNFDPKLVDEKIYWSVKVYVPENIRNKTDVTLHFNLTKMSVRDIASSSKDMMYVEGLGELAQDKNKDEMNYKPPAGDTFTYRYIVLNRKITKEDIKNTKQELMPGFSLSWYYSGLNVTSDVDINKFDNDLTNQFKRWHLV